MILATIFALEAAYDDDGDGIMLLSVLGQPKSSSPQPISRPLYII